MYCLQKQAEMKGSLAFIYSWLSIGSGWCPYTQKELGIILWSQCSISKKENPPYCNLLLLWNIETGCPKSSLFCSSNQIWQLLPSQGALSETWTKARQSIYVVHCPLLYGERNVFFFLFLVKLWNKWIWWGCWFGCALSIIWSVIDQSSLLI